MDGFFPILEALLAFALTMLLLTMAVSAVVGAATHLMRSRARNLRKTADAFYRQEVVPLLERARIATFADRDTAATPVAGETARRLFVKELTLVPNTAALTEHRRDRLPQLVEPSILPALGVWHDLSSGLDALSTPEFKTRFRGSTAGAALLPKAADVLAVPAPAGTAPEEALLDELGRRFAAYLDAAAEALTRRLRPWHVVASFVLVLTLQVDAIELVKSYLRDRKLVATVIETTLPKVQGSAQPPAGNGGTVPVVQPAVLERVKSLIGNGDLSPEDKEVALRLFTTGAAVVSSEEAQKAWREVMWLVDGLPIGGGGYPFCAVDAVDSRCPRAGTATSAEESPPVGMMAVTFAEIRGFFPPEPSSRWLMGLLLTTLMVGLGTTVWTDIVDRLLGMRGRLRGQPTAPPPRAPGT